MRTCGPGTTCTRSSVTRTSRSSRAGRCSTRGPARRSRRDSGCSSAPTRSAIPGSSPRTRDARPRQRRPRDPGHRRRVDGARAQGPWHRLRERLRRASRLARRVGRRDAPRARRRVRHLGAGRPLPVQRPAPQPAAGPEASADHDRRQRREEDAPDGRPLRRHVERDGPGRRDDATRSRSCQGHCDAVGRDIAEIDSRSASSSTIRDTEAEADPRLEGRDGAQQDAAGGRRGRRRRSGTAPPSRSPTACGPTSSSASGPSSPSSPRRTTPRRSSASSARSCRSSDAPVNSLLALELGLEGSIRIDLTIACISARSSECLSIRRSRTA